MSFWQKYQIACNAVRKSPNAVAGEAGVSSGSVTGWKNGAVPKITTIEQLAGALGVPASYFIEEGVESVAQKNKPAPTSEGGPSKKSVELAMRITDLSEEDQLFLEGMISRLESKVRQ